MGGALALLTIVGLIYMFTKMHKASQSQEYKDLKEKYKKAKELRNGDISSEDMKRMGEIDRSLDHHSFDHTIDTNPGTGLPMSNGIGGVDVGGKPYGSN